MSETTDGGIYGFCTRCPKVGRTGAERGLRDSPHYYCRTCRAEYQKNRYRASSFDTIIVEHLESAIQALESSMAIIRRTEGPEEAMEKFMPLTSVEDHLRRVMQLIVDKGQVRKGTTIGVGADSEVSLGAYLDMLWKANAIDDVQTCYDALEAIKKYYPEENVEWIEKIISRRPEPKDKST